MSEISWLLSEMKRRNEEKLTLVLRTSYTFLIVPSLWLIPNLWDLLETCHKGKISSQSNDLLMNKKPNGPTNKIKSL